MTLEEFSKIAPNGKPSKWHYVQDELFINRHKELIADIKEPVSTVSAHAFGSQYFYRIIYAFTIYYTTR